MKRWSRASAAALGAVMLLAASQAANASTAPKWSDEQLVDFSAAIVTGRVIGIASDWDSNTIYTYITVEVGDVLKGGISERQIVLKQAGGVVGPIGLKVSGQSRFYLGEEILAFAEVRPRDGTLYTTALWQGKWTIEIDAATGRRSAVRSVPDADGGEVDRRDLLAFASAIAARASQGVQSSAFVANPEAPIGDGADPFVLLDSPARWDTQPVLVDIQSGGQPGLPGGGITQLQNDFAAWNGAGGLFTYSQRSTSAASRCGNVFGNSGVVTHVFNDPCAEISNAGGTLAVAFSWFTTAISQTVNGQPFRRMLEVVIVSNDSATAQQFILNAPCFAQVMLHEQGHALGLGHSADANAIMFATVSFAQCSTSFRTLNADDIAGIRFIYPGGSPTTLLPPTNLVAIVVGNSVTVSFTAATGAASYRLIANGPGVAFDQNIGALTSVSGSGLPAGTFTIQVYSVSSTGAQSATAATTTFTIGGGPGPCVAPPTPTGLTGSVVGGLASVSFNPSPGATSYIVQAGTAFGASNLFNANIGPSTSASAGVPPGFTAYVRVIAVTGTCQSAPTADLALGFSLGVGDLQVTLSWNTAVDMDLHIIEPNGTHVYYANRNGTTARLDRDDTDGFGPENIFVNPGAAAAGTYQVYIVQFSSATPTSSTIQIRVNAGTANELYQVFTRNTPGGNSGVGYNVANVNVGARTITETTGTRTAVEGQVDTSVKK